MSIPENKLRNTIQNRLQFLRTLGMDKCMIEHKRLYVWHTTVLKELVSEYNDKYGKDCGYFNL